MYPFQHILETLRGWLRNRLSRNFRLEVDTLHEIRLIAERQNRTPEEIADQIIVDAIHNNRAQADNYSRWLSLTRREKEVAALICLGYNTQEITERLSIAKPTVKTHVTHILSKFNVPNRHALRLLLNGWDFSGWDQM